ncbi:hypothetical protein MTLP_02800 [Candidatus Methanoliparum sp. LAM-1]|nr:hypothetical protein MTLP_02800 [Candidatus Methanoliparum sp. LAM-1]
MDRMNSITAKIKGIKYTPLLCRKLHTFNFSDLDKALSKEATFILKIDDKNQIAVSWWVSAKRTRSYPYARVYDSLSFAGKKVTIIPIVKDEGKDGDRDFLQWDTVSLMSLLGVYVIIAYYNDATKKSRYENKITEQRFDIDYLKNQIKELLSYQSDALHWNLSQIDNIAEIGKKALDSYIKISQKLGVEMHSKESAEKRIAELKKGKNTFMELSRNLAKMAQKRESVTIQPKEHLEGIKGTITITNYLGGNYYFTSDEVELYDKNIYLIDAKHTKENKLPSLEDIKDGLLKMILFTNLEDVKIGNEKFTPIPILKLTTAETFKIVDMNKSQKEMFEVLKKEAQINNFNILLNKHKIL